MVAAAADVAAEEAVEMDTTHVTRQLGQGVGWRPQLDGAIAHADGLGFIEVIAEAIGAHGVPAGVAAAMRHGSEHRVGA